MPYLKAVEKGFAKWWKSDGRLMIDGVSSSREVAEVAYVSGLKSVRPESPNAWVQSLQDEVRQRRGAGDALAYGPHNLGIYSRLSKEHAAEIDQLIANWEAIKPQPLGPKEGDALVPIRGTLKALAELSNAVDQQHGRIHKDQLTALAQAVVDLFWNIQNLEENKHVGRGNPAGPNQQDLPKV